MNLFLSVYTHPVPQKKRLYLDSAVRVLTDKQALPVDVGFQ